MRCTSSWRARLRFALVCGSLWMVGLSGFGLLSSSAAELTAVRVEEDWELVVETPDPNSTAPQITCTFSPTGTVDSLHATFDLNHQSYPEFASGGLQLQVWEGESALGAQKFPQETVMSTEGETVRWTQSMELDNGVVTFEVTNGSSTTWGSFGGQGYLKLFVASSLTSLNGYDPAVSAAHSGIGYAGNRAASLVLKRVRVILSSGEVLEDTTERVVYPDS